MEEINLLEITLATIRNHLTLPSIYHFMIGMAVLYIGWVFVYWFTQQKVILFLEFSKSGELQPTNFMKEFNRAFILGTLHVTGIAMFVFAINYYFPLAALFQFIIVVSLFNVFLIKNKKALMYGSIFSLYIFVPFYFFMIGSPLYFIAMYAFASTCYKQLYQEEGNA